MIAQMMSSDWAYILCTRYGSGLNTDVQCSYLHAYCKVKMSFFSVKWKRSLLDLKSFQSKYVQPYFSAILKCMNKSSGRQKYKFFFQFCTSVQKSQNFVFSQHLACVSFKISSLLLWTFFRILKCILNNKCSLNGILCFSGVIFTYKNGREEYIAVNIVMAHASDYIAI